MKKARAFTLIELLVAISLLSIASLLAWRGLDSVLRSSEHIETKERRWRSLTLFMERLAFDLTQPADRPVRRGEVEQAAWRLLPPVTAQDSPELHFTRQPLTAGEALRRIGYRLRDGRIEYLVWAELDSARDTPPRVYPLLQEVKRFDLAFLGADNKWTPQWSNDSGWPRGVSMHLETLDGYSFKRTFALP